MDAHLLALSSSPPEWTPRMIWVHALVGVALIGVATLVLPWLLGWAEGAGPRSPYPRRMLRGLRMVGVWFAGTVGLLVLAVRVLEPAGSIAIVIVSCLVALWVVLRRQHPPAAPRRQSATALAALGAVVGLLVLMNVHYQRGLYRAIGALQAHAMRSIGDSLTTYHDRFGTGPDDLRRLIEADLATPGDLQAPGGRTPPSEDSRLIPVDFRYNPLPPDAPDDLIWVWLAGHHRQAPGGWGLYRDGKVYWHEPEELLEALGRTRQWMEDREGP